MMSKTVFSILVVLLVGSFCFGAADFTNEPIIVDVEWTSNNDYEGSFLTGISSDTANGTYLVRGVKINDDLKWLTCPNSNNCLDIYNGVTVDDDGEASFYVVVGNDTTKDIFMDFYLELYVDSDGDGEFDSGDDTLVDVSICSTT